VSNDLVPRSVAEKMTFKAMCEEIVAADFLRKKDGTAPTAEEIWRYSPTGELYMIFEWYETALVVGTFKKKLRVILLGMIKDFPNVNVEVAVKKATK
jgi:hypothetical protein